VEDHEEALRRGFAEGADAHGALDLPFETFARRALELTARRLRRGGEQASREEVAEALSRAALSDLFLAIACEERAPGSWEALAGRTRGTVVALALRRGASRAEAEDLAEEIPGELFVAPPRGEARTRLGTYDGSGTLAGWLAVIVGRRLADRRRVAARVRPAPGGRDEDEGTPDPRARPGDFDPAALAADAETARRFEEALRSAWVDLTDRERLVLRFRFADGLAQTEIARCLGVGEPRVSRSIRVAVEKIRSDLARRLDPRPGEGDRDPGHTWAALERAVAEFMGTLPPSSDSSTDG